MLHPHHLSRLTNCALAAAHARLIDVGGIEVPVPTHDGHVWPLTRHMMLDPAAIRVRLAEDIIEQWRENDGHLNEADLVKLGWDGDGWRRPTLAWRIRDHLASAVALAAKARPDLAYLAAPAAA